MPGFIRRIFFRRIGSGGSEGSGARIQEPEFYRSEFRRLRSPVVFRWGVVGSPGSEFWCCLNQGDIVALILFVFYGIFQASILTIIAHPGAHTGSNVIRIK